MHDGLGEQVVELSIVTAFRGGGIDFEQRFGFGPAHGLIGHSHRGQDTRAPGGVLSIERTGKMNTAPRCGTFASDHAVAHDAQRIYCHVLVTTFRCPNGPDQFVRYSDKGRHCTVLFFQIVESSSARLSFESLYSRARNSFYSQVTMILKSAAVWG